MSHNNNDFPKYVRFMKVNSTIVISTTELQKNLSEIFFVCNPLSVHIQTGLGTGSLASFFSLFIQTLTYTMV